MKKKKKKQGKESAEYSERKVQGKNILIFPINVFVTRKRTTREGMKKKGEEEDEEREKGKERMKEIN